jgi:hypothetical protein
MKPNPWLILAVLIALGAFYGYGHHKGWTQRDQEMQVEIARKNNEARKTEQEMTQKLAETSNALQEANNVVTKKQTALDAAIRAGRVRLPTPSCVSAPQSPAPSARDTETRSEPDRPTNETSDADRATLAAIAEIVAQGDRNTAQLNACVEAYTKVMESINGQR